MHRAFFRKSLSGWLAMGLFAFQAYSINSLDSVRALWEKGNLISARKLLLKEKQGSISKQDLEQLNIALMVNDLLLSGDLTIYQYWKELMAVKKFPENAPLFFYLLDNVFTRQDPPLYTKERRDDLRKTMRGLHQKYKSGYSVPAFLESIYMNGWIREKRDHSDVPNIDLYIDEWQAIGPYPNFGGFGWSRTHTPLYEQCWEKVKERGKYLVWVQTGKYKDLHIVYNRGLFTSSHQLAYLQTFFETSEDTLVLHIEHKDPVRVWLDGVEIYSEPNEIVVLSGARPIAVKVNPGIHRLVVQMGGVQSNSNYIMARIANARGQKPKGFRVISNGCGKSTSGGVQVIPSPIENTDQWLYDKLEKGNIQIPEAYYLLTVLELLKKDAYRKAYNVLKDMKKEFPSHLFTLYARYMYAIYTDNSLEQRKTRQKIKDAYENSLIAMRFELSDEFSKMEYEEADSMVNAFIQKASQLPLDQFPALDILIHEYKMDLADRKDKETEVIAIQKKLLEKYPDYEPIVDDYIDILLDEGKGKKAIKLAVAYTDKFPTYSNIISTVRVFVRAGKEKNAISYLKKKISKHGHFAGGLYIQLGDLYFSMNDFKSAEANYKLAQKYKFYPLRTLLERLYEAYKGQGNVDSALAYLHKILSLYPIDVDQWREIWELQEKNVLIESVKPQLEPDSILKIKVPDSLANEHAIILYLQSDRHIYPHYPVESRIYFLIKVMTEEAATQFREMRIPAKKAEIIKPDGTVIKADMGFLFLPTIFDELEAGDIIYLELEGSSAPQNDLFSYFYDYFAVGFETPILKININVIQHKDWTVNLKKSGFDIVDTIQLEEGYFNVRLEAENIEDLPPEPASPPASIVSPYYIVFSAYPSWEYIGVGYRDILKRILAIDYPVLDDELNTILDSINQNVKGDKERLFAFIRYFNENFDYSHVPFREGRLIPKTPQETFVLKSGDCKDVTSLFLYMARKMKFPSKFYIVEPEYQQNNRFLLPTTIFSHIVAAVQIGSEEIIVDLTDKYLPPGSFPLGLFGVPALGAPFEPDTGKITFGSLKPRFNYVKATIINNSEVTINDAGKLTMKVNRYVSGQLASIAKHKYLDMTPEDIHDDLKETITETFSDYHVTVDSIAYDFKRDTVWEYFEFTIDDYVTSLGKMSQIEIPFMDRQIVEQLSTYFVRETRKLPLIITTGEIEVIKDSISITYPQGWQVYELPFKQQVKLQSEHFKWVAHSSQPKKRVVVTRTLELSPYWIYPEEYPKERETFFDIKKHEKSRLLFEKR
ncbi:MAG: hypothetical protein GXO48_00175 [Chlorobi bacterium]|nr:hypothetical protein [Chlorobiota bacterium]